MAENPMKRVEVPNNVMHIGMHDQGRFFYIIDMTNKASIYYAFSREELYTFEDCTPSGIAFTHNSNHVIIQQGDSLECYDLRRNRCIFTIDDPGVSHIHISDDDTTLLAYSSEHGTINLYRLHITSRKKTIACELIHSLTLDHQAGISCGPNNRLLVLETENGNKLYNIESEQQLFITPCSISISPDKQHLALLNLETGDIQIFNLIK